jgi:anti-sigma factor RsiW
MRPEPVTDAEIDAWIDDELDLVRRHAVEEHLARHPELAARTFADLGRRTALRLTAAAGEGAPSTTLARAADALAARLSGGPLAGRRPGSVPWGWTTAAGALAAALLLAVGLAPSARPAPAPAAPEYLADAMMAYRTGLIRAAMESQPETTDLDTGDIRRRTHIRLPRLMAGWRITDVQLFPSEEGPAVQVMVRTPDQRAFAIFAVRADSGAPEDPLTIRREGHALAYWGDADMSYALIGQGTRRSIDQVADRLAAQQPI